MTVTVIVRSMGRPELKTALESIAAQDYSPLEVVVVDATGGNHPPLPDIKWREGEPCRMVGKVGLPLSRPEAAQLGLESVRGDCFCFLDDDDTYEPNHISTLIEAWRTRPSALVVYSRSNMLDGDGKVLRVYGKPFNRSLMYHSALFYWQAAIFSSKVIGMGVHFDYRFDIFEDHDFVNQVAEHGDFLFVPAVTFNYRPYLGTSGACPSGPNWNEERMRSFYFMMRNKWKKQSDYHAAIVREVIENSSAEYKVGHIEDCQVQLLKLLQKYPQEPNALHAFARINLDAGRLKEAKEQVECAIGNIPESSDFRLTYALILEKLAMWEEAKTALRFAQNDPRLESVATKLLERINKIQVMEY